MNQFIFKSLNYLVLIILIVFNSFVFIAYSIGEGAILWSDWLLLILPFILWGAFYYVQKKQRTYKMAYIWFFIMVILLYFWESGSGALLIRHLS
ncbi:hypothetical protein CKW00_13005 [Salimicrobium humidisoli]|uniref:Uncharacterized protein n=1 Tax=Salimicrobium humidisoli TaxID=2029857 RepID=A0ABX4HN75_9BACI|nr:hypothetical protein CKW00_13005 [Salimicrobium humidisoli]